MSSTTYSLIRVLAALAVVACVRPAAAVEPTHLEPAESVNSGEIALEQTVEWEHHDSDEGVAETEISYGLTPKLKLGLTVPAEFEDGEGVELGNVGIFAEGVANPDADRAPLIGGELKIHLPTGDDADGVGVEGQIRISKYFGADGKHGLHLNLLGYYDAVESEDEHFLHDEDDSEDEFSYGAVLGYTCQVTEKTGLVFNVVHIEYTDSDADETLAEVGVKHDFTDSISGALGVGFGLDDDSPDVTAKAGIEFRFGHGKHT